MEKLKLAVVMVVFLSLSLVVESAEPTVKNDANRSKTTEKNKALNREKAIDIQQMQSNRKAKAVDEITSRVFSNEVLNQFTIRRDTQASVVLVPLVAAIERGEVNMGNNPISNTIQRCGLYSYPHPSPAYMFTRKEQIVAYQYGIAKQVPVPGTPTHIAVTGNLLYKYMEVMDSKPQRFSPASEAVKCYITYGVLMAESIKEMVGLSVGEKQSPRKAKTYFLADNVEQVAARSLMAVIADPLTNQTVNQTTENILAGGCMLPTLVAINSGDFTWACGGIDFNPAVGMAKRSGTPYFGENTFMGVSASFSQVDALAMVNNMSNSDISRVSTIKEKGDSSSTRMSKRLALVNNSSSKKDRSSGSGVAQ